jgi:hypothetical protein
MKGDRPLVVWLVVLERDKCLDMVRQEGGNVTGFALTPPQFHDTARWNFASQTDLIFIIRKNAMISQTRRYNKTVRPVVACDSHFARRAYFRSWHLAGNRVTPTYVHYWGNSGHYRVVHFISDRYNSLFSRQDPLTENLILRRYWIIHAENITPRVASRDDVRVPLRLWKLRRPGRHPSVRFVLLPSRNAAVHESASLIGRSGSIAFRLSTTAVSMPRANSCFSSESAPRRSIMGFENEVEQSFGVALPSDKWQVQADKRTHLIHRPARDIIPPLGGARVL